MKSSGSKAPEVSLSNGSCLQADGVSELEKKVYAALSLHSNYDVIEIFLLNFDSSQVEELQQENLQLKQLSIKQQQIITQTRSFLGELKERATPVPR
jgi:hypothetical protein